MRLTIASMLFMTISNVSAQNPDVVSGDIIVQVVHRDAIQHIVDRCAQTNGLPTGLHVVRELSKPLGAWLLHHNVDSDAHDVLQMLRSQPEVTSAQFNRRVTERSVPNDPQYGDQWMHDVIASESAWDVSTGGVTSTGDTIVVAVIEPADLWMPDLAANHWYNIHEVPFNFLDDDGNGYVDDHRGWNHYNNIDDVYGGLHGTGVSGVIGATGNDATGVVGVNWNVKLMAVPTDLTEAGIIQAYTYPLVMRRLYDDTNGALGAFVVATNSSWGVDYGQAEDYPIWCAMYDTLGGAGILSCGATLNSFEDVDVVGDMPTTCTSEYLISVTATDTLDQCLNYGYGAESIDVGAPGEELLVIVGEGQYGAVSGTSGACPVVTGVIALLYSAPCEELMNVVREDPGQGARLVRDALFAGVDQVGNLQGLCTTNGRVNASNSLQYLMSECSSVTGITSGEPAHHIRCYPNPARTTVVFDLGEQRLRPGAILEIIDGHGRRVGHYSPTSDRMEVATELLAAGSYTFRLVSDDRVMASGAFEVVR